MNLTPLRKQGKKAAIEMSVGTMVIIVIAVVMLVLALIFVRRIFSGATESANIIDDKVKAKIQNLFGDESRNVIVSLGPDKIAKVRPNTESFGVAVGARTSDGTQTTRDRLVYKLTLGTPDDCIKKNGQSVTKSFFLTPLDDELEFDEFEGDSAFSIISIRVPEETAFCTQKVLIDVTDTKTNKQYGGAFIIEVVRGGFAFF